MTAKETREDSTCPVCGAGNQCAASLGIPVEQCWCQSADIAPATLAKIPADKLGTVCICPACANPIGAKVIER